MATKILRIPREDDASFVLVHVAPTTGGSSRPLDLTLIGTDGAAPYDLKVKQKSVLSHKNEHSLCNDGEWQLLLESILLGKSLDGSVELLQNVEVVAAVDEEKAINIRVMRRIEGITQSLGSFKLSRNDRQEIELFEWCGLAAEASSRSTNELSSLNSKLREQQDTIDKLTSQLEELVKAKLDHETELIEKFRWLLNEKKAKIRDQSRLLAFSKVDPKKLAEANSSRKGRSTGASGSRKRKEQISEDSEDDAFEKMDADDDRSSNDSERSEFMTPDLNDNETADEDEEPVAPAPAKNRGNAQKTLHGSSKGLNEPMEGLDQSQSTPPKRELPFSKKAVQPKNNSMLSKDVANDEGDDTESDDEL